MCRLASATRQDSVGRGYVQYISSFLASAQVAAAAPDPASQAETDHDSDSSSLGPLKEWSEVQAVFARFGSTLETSLRSFHDKAFYAYRHLKGLLVKVGAKPGRSAGSRENADPNANPDRRM